MLKEIYLYSQTVMPVHIPQSEIDKLACQAQIEGIFALGEYMALSLSLINSILFKPLADIFCYVTNGEVGLLKTSLVIIVFP